MWHTCMYYVRNSNKRQIGNVRKDDSLQSGKMKGVRIIEAWTWLGGG
jgi:hypothetical protein